MWDLIVSVPDHCLSFYFVFNFFFDPLLYSIFIYFFFFKWFFITKSISLLRLMHIFT